MAGAEQRQLDEQDFVLPRDFIAPRLLDEPRAQLERVWAAEGERAGGEFRKAPHTRRLANLAGKGKVFLRVIGERFKLSSLNARAPDPQSEWIQPLHCDAGALPDEKGFRVCNVIWMLDDFTAENGATRIVPGSHRWGKYPQEVLADPVARHGDEILMLAPAGTAAVINTHAWHGGTANCSNGPRRCLHAFYTRWDKPQQQFQRDLLSAEAKRKLSPELRELLAIDDEWNAQVTPADPLRGGFLK